MSFQPRDLSDGTSLINYVHGQSARDVVGVRGAKRFYSDVVKRGFDSAVVVIFAPFVVLVVALLAALVAMEGGKPFYSQQRIGRNGRHYRMWKLRSMVPDAERKLDEYLAQNPAAKAEWDAHQKLKNDPRITRVGQIIRKTSLDELPQLWNVLKGDMSLVGPRPMMVDQQKDYPGTAYYALRPGITGSWQVSDRHESTFAARARYDAEYLRDLSLSTDMNILARTVGVVLRGTGC